MNRIISRFGRSTTPSGTSTPVMPSAQAWIQNQGNDLARCLPRRLTWSLDIKFYAEYVYLAKSYLYVCFVLMLYGEIEILL